MNDNIFSWRRIIISEAVEDINNLIDNVKYDTNSQQCPECQGTIFEYDYKRAETICKNPQCGLVIAGPPGYIAGRIQIKYPVQYNFFSEAIGKGHNTRHGYYRAYYYFPEYTNDLY